MKDSASGRVFYHNTSTGESSWERPADHDNEWMGDGDAASQHIILILYFREDILPSFFFFFY